MTPEQMDELSDPVFVAMVELMREEAAAIRRAQRR